MGDSQLLSWIEHEILPPPIFIDNNGVRYFDVAWLKKARKIVRTKMGDVD